MKRETAIARLRNFEFQSHRGHECTSVLNVVCCQERSLQRTNHSSRGVVPSVVCLSAISKPQR